MGSKVDEKNRDDQVPVEKKLDDLYELIDEGGERDGGPDDPRITLILVE
jgi:hypothetical protein